MITAIKSSDMLIEGVLDHGLTFIGDYWKGYFTIPFLLLIITVESTSPRKKAQPL